jgi:hypothetical protein
LLEPIRNIKLNSFMYTREGVIMAS